MADGPSAFFTREDVRVGRALHAPGAVGRLAPRRALPAGDGRRLRRRRRQLRLGHDPALLHPPAALRLVDERRLRPLHAALPRHRPDPHGRRGRGDDRERPRRDPGRAPPARPAPRPDPGLRLDRRPLDPRARRPQARATGHARRRDDFGLYATRRDKSAALLESDRTRARLAELALALAADIAAAAGASEPLPIRGLPAGATTGDARADADDTRTPAGGSPSPKPRCPSARRRPRRGPRSATARSRSSSPRRGSAPRRAGRC